jgi:hypothetical protein
MKSKTNRGMDILKIVVSLLVGDIAFGKFLSSALDTIEDTIDRRICSKLNLNLTSTNSQPILNPQKGFFMVLYSCLFSI